MPPSGPIRDRRAANARALAAFGVPANGGASGEGRSTYRVVHEGKPGGTVFFTIGYEGRTGEQLIGALREAGVRHLADVRQKPVSRKADFRAGPLRTLCEDAGIEYGAWTELGAPEAQRTRLKETGDIKHFFRVFRRHAAGKLGPALERLMAVARPKPVALLCYERAHDECHRSVIADLLAERFEAGVTAIL